MINIYGWVADRSKYTSCTNHIWRQSGMCCQFAVVTAYLTSTFTGFLLFGRFIPCGENCAGQMSIQQSSRKVKDSLWAETATPGGTAVLQQPLRRGEQRTREYIILNQQVAARFNLYTTVTNLWTFLLRDNRQMTKALTHVSPRPQRCFLEAFIDFLQASA